MFRVILACMGVAVVSARDANMRDVEAVAEANVQEAAAILKAAKALPTPEEQVKNIEALNAAEMEQLQSGGDEGAAALGGSKCGGCVRDYSQQVQADGCYPCRNTAFLASRTQGPAQSILQYMVRPHGSSVGLSVWRRETQAPYVWMHLHKADIGQSFLQTDVSDVGEAGIDAVQTMHATARMSPESHPPLRLKVAKSGRVYASDRLLQGIRNEVNAYMASEIGSFMQEVAQRSSFLQAPTGVSGDLVKEALFATQQLRYPAQSNINVVDSENVPAVQQEAAYLALKSQSRKLHDAFRRNLLKMKAHSVH